MKTDVPAQVPLSAGLGFTVGDEVTVTRRLWEPADDCHPGGMLAQPGDRLIVRAIRDRGEWPISVSHHDRTDGMTFAVAANEIRAYTLSERMRAAGFTRRPSAKSLPSDE